LKRIVDNTNYEIQSNGHLKNVLSGDRKIKALVGKDLLVKNGHQVVLWLIQNAELAELEELQEGLFLTVVK
jgi:hypothetical protein